MENSPTDLKYKSTGWYNPIKTLYVQDKNVLKNKINSFKKD